MLCGLICCEFEIFCLFVCGLVLCEVVEYLGVSVKIVFNYVSLFK